MFVVKKMGSRSRILNVSRPHFGLKPSQAVRGIEDCVYAWVEFGVSVRDLRLDEQIAARNRKAMVRDPLPCFELPGLAYRAQSGNEAAVRMERARALEANRFVLR